MKKLFSFITLFLCIFSPELLNAQPDQSYDDVIGMIHKVNRHWQTDHSPKVWAFWEEAVYQTGNMEAYALTGEKQYLQYARDWADHNEWKGAKSANRAEWSFVFGTNDLHVLFGDWQICFQTYADLYQINPQPYKVARAKEVMEYQMSTPKKDYWFWVDALYMVMPVMTKLYNITGNESYLDKLYEYVLACDSIMYDTETSLYFRDAKYLYPKHKTENGRKDFWSRGNGWAFAAYAKVLNELPKHSRYRAHFIKRYREMAKAVAKCQQPEGFWSRSMLDEQQAPGYETSGTALFAYGFLWGIKNGILERAVFQPVAEKAWNYLSTTAIQPDGSVGYIQPIGERAIPGQTVDAASTYNFGVGAFLLAACEQARFLKKENEGQTVRAFWCDVMYRMATPVLSNMSEGNLQKNMLLELSPTWDGRDKRVSYMECFGRLMAGIAPWLSLPDDETPEGEQRKQLRGWALQSYKNAVDPQSPDYLLWSENFQTLVDAAYVAQSFLRAYDTFWMPLDEVTKSRYIKEFTGLRRINPLYTNWLLFTGTIETFLQKAGAPADDYRISSSLRKINEWYVGDGWYSDGPAFSFDYYSSFVIHPMYFDCLDALTESGKKSKDYAGCNYNQEIKRMQRFGAILERFISPEGTFPVVGRSITYRTGVLQPLAVLALKEKIPEELSNGQVRTGMNVVIERMFGANQNFNEKGFLTLGFNGSQPSTANVYTNNGSLYLAALAFLPLGLPADHPFWTEPAESWTSKKAWDGEEFPKDHTYYEKFPMNYQ